MLYPEMLWKKKNLQQNIYSICEFWYMHIGILVGSMEFVHYIEIFLVGGDWSNYADICVQWTSPSTFKILPQPWY